MNRRDLDEWRWLCVVWMDRLLCCLCCACGSSDRSTARRLRTRPMMPPLSQPIQPSRPKNSIEICDPTERRRQQTLVDGPDH